MGSPLPWAGGGRGRRGVGGSEHRRGFPRGRRAAGRAPLREMRRGARAPRPLSRLRTRPGPRACSSGARGPPGHEPSPPPDAQSRRARLANFETSPPAQAAVRTSRRAAGKRCRGSAGARGRGGPGRCALAPSGDLGAPREGSTSGRGPRVTVPVPGTLVLPNLGAQAAARVGSSRRVVCPVRVRPQRRAGKQAAWALPHTPLNGLEPRCPGWPLRVPPHRPLPSSPRAG